MLDLKKALPEILKVTEVWPDFMDAITQELTYLQTDMKIKENYFNVDEYTDKDALLDFCRAHGYSPNLLLDNSLSYVQKEANDLIFKIRNKATYYYYEYIFKTINEAGNMYILFQDSTRLVRAIDASAVFTALDSHDLSTPFTEFQEILHFSDYLEQLIQLDNDPLLYLDGSPIWYLDQDIVIKPTNHLSIEYAIDSLSTLNGEEYITVPNSLHWLGKMVEYGRKATQVPHIGAQITFMMDSSGYYDNISGVDYSIPILKTNCVVTSAYDSESTDDLTQFNKMVVGIGQKSMVNASNGSVLEDIDLWYSFDNINDVDAMNDLSDSEYVASITGDYIEIDGSIGKTIYFNGSTVEAVTLGFVLNQSNKTLNFWVKGDTLGQSYTQSRLIYISGSLNGYYDHNLKKILFTLIGDSSSATVEYEIDLTNNETNICITMNTSGNMSLYVNNNLEDFADISAIGSWGITDTLYIGGQNGTNYFKGYIDEFRVYDKLLSESERTYLYVNKAGSLVRLANPVYEQQLSDNQTVTNINWQCIFASIPSGTIDNEIIGYGDGVTNTFTGYTVYNQIALGSLIFTYVSSTTTYTATTDQFGNIEGDRVSGTINFTTGAFTLNTYERTLKRNEVIYEGATSEIIGYTTGFPNIEAGTFYMYAYIGDTLYTITDDGEGNLQGTGITTGTINYTTGEINATFNGTTDSGQDVICKYYYRKYSTPDNLSTIYASYKTNQDIAFTEAGIKNDDGDIVAYATFPPTKFYSVLNHISFQFMIDKKES